MSFHTSMIKQACKAERRIGFALGFVAAMTLCAIVLIASLFL